MKYAHFWDAVGEIDDDLIAEAHRERKPQRHSVRLVRRGLLAAVILVGLSLSLMAYGQGRWFSLFGKQALKDTAWYRIRDDKDEHREYVEPAARIEFNDPNGGTVVGFRISDETGFQRYDRSCESLRVYLDYQPAFPSAALAESELDEAYFHYECCTVDGGRICAWMLERTELGVQDLICYTGLELVKEGVLQGMETLWVRTAMPDNPLSDYQYYLICRSPELGCVLTVFTLLGFEEAETLAERLILVDSGVRIERSLSRTVYALPVPDNYEEIAGVTIARHSDGAPPIERDLEITGTSIRRLYEGAALKDRNQNVDELYYALNLPLDNRTSIYATVFDRYYNLEETLSNCGDPNPLRETVNGHAAWRYDAGKTVGLIIIYEELDCLVELSLNTDYKPADVHIEKLLCGNPDVLEQLGAALTPVPVEILEDRPLVIGGKRY